MRAVEARGRAPGKIILLGEHAVVYGEPAIGFPLSRGVSVEVTRGSGRVVLEPEHPIPRGRGASPRDLVRAALGPLLEGHDVFIALDLPPMAGLGSSAALAVALLRARGELTGERLRDPALLVEATRVEDVAHGRSSGVDPAIAIARAPILFLRSRDARRVRRLPLASPLYLVVGARGGHGGTGRSVGRIAELRKGAPRLFSSVLGTLGEATRTAARALSRGDLEAVGRTLDLAHGVLAGLGLVSKGIEEIVQAARAAGALGVKMSGAGGAGGAFVAIARDAASAKRIQAAVSRLGAGAWIERAGA